MIARSFRPVGWVAAVGAAALGCYMLSLRVAAERADLGRLDARIVAASQSIRSLQTELGTRGRMQQLEAWNEEVLALSAPVSGQFVEGNVSLARFDIRQPQIAPDADVRLASAEAQTASPQAPAPAMAAPRRAVAATAPVAPPMVRRASLTIPAATAAATPATPVSRKRRRSNPRGTASRASSAVGGRAAHPVAKRKIVPAAAPANAGKVWAAEAV
ncbi:MAG TPA: hypothetical protein VES64_04825, partial [Allosphingosinicella sp.]|nr:hypothetical protein [Allosphingosinicella sp.]